MAIIYEVNLNVDAGVADRFKNWLVNHVNEMLQIPGFTRAVCCSELDTPAGKSWFSVRYELHNRAAFEHYLTYHAERMRQSGIDNFGNKLTATRRLLTPFYDEEQACEPQCN